MPGLLDDYGSLIRGKPKIMPLAGSGGFDPTAAMGMTAGDELDPFGKGRLAEALEVRGPAPAPIPGGTLAGPNQQRAFAFGDQPGAGFGPRPPPGLSVAQADAAPPKINLAEMNFGFGDKEFPMKQPGQMPRGLQITPPEPSPPPSLIAGPAAPAAPGPAGGGGSPSLISGQPSLPASSPFVQPSTQTAGLPLTAPLPPIRPPTQLAGMQGADGPRWRTDPPQPPPRPASLTAGGNPTPPPNPIIPPKIGPAPPSIASAAAGPITPAPIAPPVTAPIAPPIAPAASAGAGAAAGAAGGGLGGLGGIMSGIAGIAKGIAGNKGPPPPEAKAPQITPMGQDTMKAGIAQGSQQALQGILSSPSLIDPRKRMQGLA